MFTFRKSESLKGNKVAIFKYGYKLNIRKNSLIIEYLCLEKIVRLLFLVMTQILCKLT